MNHTVVIKLLSFIVHTLCYALYFGCYIKYFVFEFKFMVLHASVLFPLVFVADFAAATH